MECYFWLLVRVGLVNRVIEPNWEHLNSNISERLSMKLVGCGSKV